MSVTKLPRTIVIAPTLQGGGYAAYSDLCKGTFVSEFSGLKHHEASGPVKDLIENAENVSQHHMLKKFTVENRFKGFNVQKRHRLY